MQDPMTAAVRLRLADLLKERGLTQIEFARRSRLSENAVSKLTGRPRQIKLETIERVCDTLEIEPGELFIREED